MSTLLTDLDSATPNKDGDLVDQILREMNSGGGGPPPPAPAIPSSQGMIMDPMPNTGMHTRVMDAGPQTAHIIGGSQPTPADFAAAMHGVPYAPSAPFAPSAATPAPSPRARKSVVGKLTEEFKNPILVALLVFVFSLPVVNFLFAHYLPWSVLPTGQLTMVGLLLKSVCAGGLFWVLQRIIIPLLNM